MLTEQQNPNTLRIDNLSSLEIVDLMNREDQQVAHAVKAVLPQIARAVDAIVERIDNGGRLIYIGAGTSGRLGVLDAVECVPTFSASPELVVGVIAGGSGALTKAVEGAEDNADLARTDLQALKLSYRDAVVGIAASGATPYVLGAMAYAKEVNAMAVSVTCNVPAPVLDAADIGIGLVVGPEVITGSTRLKSGTAQKMVLNMLSTATFVKLGKVYGNLMVDVQITNSKLARRARNIVMQVGGVGADEAERLIATASSEVKTAIVMARRGVSADEARALLTAARGHLRRVID